MSASWSDGFFVWPSSVRHTDQSKHRGSLELESFSCQPEDVPHLRVLMAFYGSLESLWLLRTQWDLVQTQRGLQRGEAATIQCRCSNLWTQGKEALSGFSGDSNLHIFGLVVSTLDYFFHELWAVTMCGVFWTQDYAYSIFNCGCLGQTFGINILVKKFCYSYRA